MAGGSATLMPWPPMTSWMALPPGEREEVTLRPHPLAWGWHYFAAAFFAIWALVLWLWFRSAAWTTPPDSPVAQTLVGWLYGNGVAAGVYLVAGVLVAGLSVAWVRQRPWWVVPYVVAAAGAVTLTAVTRPAAYADLLPGFLAPWAILALAWVEMERQNHVYCFTNLRIRLRSGLQQRPCGEIRYSHITDLDIHHPPLGRAFDMATITPVPRDGEPVVVLRGMRPASRVRVLLQVMVDRVNDTPYADDKKELQEQMESAIAHFRRRAVAAEPPRTTK